jgi:hypothetical protein
LQHDAPMGMDEIGPSQTAGTLLKRIVDRGLTPGLQYLAVDANGPLAEHAVGLADVGRGECMTRRHTLMAYSMSKTITAAAVLQLVEDGCSRGDQARRRRHIASPRQASSAAADAAARDQRQGQTGAVSPP